MHTPGRAAELGRRGGSAGRGSKAWREKRPDAFELATHTLTLGAIIASEREDEHGQHDDDERRHQRDRGDAGGGGSTVLSEASLEYSPGRKLSTRDETPTPDLKSTAGEFDPVRWMAEQAAVQNAKERAMPDPGARPWEQWRDDYWK